ncbi:glycosyl hydrolase [Cellvibrio zantedeschiae]|uniref:Glycosyl hydrolase n=1 Tax=Cellvibrio zantedeschiae TaxID=1237077 RepID=A0ABQ3AQM6_9GAMM|nr:glycoside hydrolase family 127 protein [Cellvibrio zantedeschiae]GGY64692.1 glycosyl hydrolase [Cellvibrio zantedeschiae]
MKKIILFASCVLAMQSPISSAAELFPLNDVRLNASPFLDAQNTDLHYLMALEPDKLLAPFLREAGLPLKQESYGNWESSGLDGHVGGHYLTALALMYASTGDAEILRRLNYFVAELKRAQDNNGDGYIGGIPGGKDAFNQIAQGKMQADNFSVNGKWVPWYNLHKTFAGLRDAYKYAGNQDAKHMLIRLSDWALTLTNHLSDEQMQAMMRSEHGGMNEVFADVYAITGDQKYLKLAERFSHQAILNPLKQDQDKLTGLHANTQIPKVIGFKRIGDLTGKKDWQEAAQFFWQTVHDHRTVAIGGNSVKEHFHDDKDFSSMISEVEGPETCNTYNMLKLTEMLFLTDSKVSYADYYERALYNHILGSQRPDTGGFVYFTPMRPNHYRVYSQVDKAMWCCVGSGIESHAKYGEFIYAHDGDSLYVNLFIPSTLNWREKNVQLVQNTIFPDEESSHITIKSNKKFTLKIRYPQWVGKDELKITINKKPVAISAQPGEYVSLNRSWRKGDKIDVTLPMKTQLEQMPDQSNYYALLHGPIVLAAKTNPFPNEKVSFIADDSRMGHIAQGQLCPLEAAPLFVSDSTDFMAKIKPVAGKSLTFTAPDVVKGPNSASLEFVPFFRLHDSRYSLYLPYSTPENLVSLQAETARKEAERIALDAITVDQVAPGEQQPESDHFFKADRTDTGISNGMRWRNTKAWMSYELTDKKLEAKTLRLSFSKADAGNEFDVFINDKLIKTIKLAADATQDIYTRDCAIPESLVRASKGKLIVKFVAREGSKAGSIYGLRLLKK